MGLSKQVYTLIDSYPNRYAIDGGEVTLINDICTILNYQKIDEKHYKMIQSIHRFRNKYLSKHKEKDLRKSNKTLERREFSLFQIEVYYNNLTPYQQKIIPKIVSYILQDEKKRLSYSDSRISKAIRGVDTNDVKSVKMYYLLFKDMLLRKMKWRPKKTLLCNTLKHNLG